MIHFRECKDIKSKYIDIHNGLFWQKQSKNNIIDETFDNHIYNIKIQKNKIKKSVSRLISNQKFRNRRKKSVNNKKHKCRKRKNLFSNN